MNAGQKLRPTHIASGNSDRKYRWKISQLLVDGGANRHRSPLGYRRFVIVCSPLPCPHPSELTGKLKGFCLMGECVGTLLLFVLISKYFVLSNLKGKWDNVFVNVGWGRVNYGGRAPGVKINVRTVVFISQRIWTYLLHGNIVCAEKVEKFHNRYIGKFKESGGMFQINIRIFSILTFQIFRQIRNVGACRKGEDKPKMIIEHLSKFPA